MGAIFINGGAVGKLIHHLGDNEETVAPLLGSVEDRECDTLRDEGGACIREVYTDFMGENGHSNGDEVVGTPLIGVRDDVGHHLIGGKFHAFHRVLCDAGEHPSQEGAHLGQYLQIAFNMHCFIGDGVFFFRHRLLASFSLLKVGGSSVPYMASPSALHNRAIMLL